MQFRLSSYHLDLAACHVYIAVYLLNYGTYLLYVACACECYSVDESLWQYSVLGDDCVTVDNRSAELLNVLHQIQGTHNTWFPLGTTFRAKFWEYLPDDFLNSAAVDNYDSEELLRSFFSTTIVHPGLGRSFQIDFVREMQ